MLLTIPPMGRVERSNKRSKQKARREDDKRRGRRTRLEIIRRQRPLKSRLSHERMSISSAFLVYEVYYILRSYPLRLLYSLDGREGSLDAIA